MKPCPVAWMVYTRDGRSCYVTDNPADVTPDQRALPLYTESFPTDEALLRQALAQLEINRTNFYKAPSKSICKMLAGGNDEVITALKERLK